MKKQLPEILPHIPHTFDTLPYQIIPIDTIRAGELSEKRRFRFVHCYQGKKERERKDLCPRAKVAKKRFNRLLEIMVALLLELSVKLKKQMNRKNQVVSASFPWRLYGDIRNPIWTLPYFSVTGNLLGACRRTTMVAWGLRNYGMEEGD